MSIISFILIISSILLVEITAEERFCEKDRKLLLAGVFNIENILFGYSWKEVNAIQLWLVWSYEVKDNHLVPITKDMSVNQVFPGIPLFRAGFGLTLKCETKDTLCQSYRQLVFIFFQTSYKVFRFKNNVFTAETDRSKIPWGFQTRGEATDWFFGNRDMDNVNAIMFLSGYESKIFIVSKSSLYVSSVSIKATSLKWKKLSENKELSNTLGAFIIGSDLFINKNEEPDSVLLKYDQSGKPSVKLSVWKYFGCHQMGATESPALSGRVMEGKPEIKSISESDDNLAIILLICIIVAIVLVDIIVGAFWLSIYMKNKNSSEV